MGECTTGILMTSLPNHSTRRAPKSGKMAVRAEGLDHGLPAQTAGELELLVPACCDRKEKALASTV